jgi:hypothetical protein
VGSVRKGALRFNTFIDLTTKVKHIKKYGTEDMGVRHNGRTMGRIRVGINNEKKSKVAYIEPKQRS